MAPQRGWRWNSESNNSSLCSSMSCCCSQARCGGGSFDHAPFLSHNRKSSLTTQELHGALTAAIAAIASLGLFNRGKHSTMGGMPTSERMPRKKWVGCQKFSLRPFFLPWEIFPERWDRPTGTRRKPLEGWGSQKTGWGPSQTDVSMIQKGEGWKSTAPHEVVGWSIWNFVGYVNLETQKIMSQS